MKKPGRSGIRFAVCIRNKGYEVSLDVGKLCRIVPDPEAEKRGYLRTVEKSGSGYGYTADRFVASDVPKSLERALARVVIH
jgi:hypothetical protein